MRLRMQVRRAIEIMLPHRGDVGGRLRQAAVGVEGEAGVCNRLHVGRARVLENKIQHSVVAPFKTKSNPLPLG